MVLAEPPGEGDGPAEGGRPGPMGLPRLHRADPNPHLRAPAPVHPVQGAWVLLLPGMAAPGVSCSADSGRATAAMFMDAPELVTGPVKITLGEERAQKCSPEDQTSC